VKTFFEAFRNPDGSLRGGYNPYDTPDTFEKDLALHLQDRIARWLEAHEAKAPADADGPAPPAPEPPLWHGSPFPGLRSFGAADAPIFFGRGRETDGLVARLAKGDRFTVVVGASGSGKSSLVAAGLLPRLSDNAIPGSRDWVQVRFTPGELGDNPLIALCSGFKAWLEAQGRRVRDEAMTLQDNPETIAELISLALDGRPDWVEVLLFVDQFEELFTVVDAKYRGPFLDLIEQAVNVPRLRIVATLRADFYHYCVAQPALAELLRAGTYPVSAPGVGALFEMIDRPAARAGLTFEEGLAQRIVDETGNEPGALPLMAFALSEIYEAGRADTELTHAAYEGFGGVKGAISQRAESTFMTLDAEAQATLEQVFRGLLEVEEADTHWVSVRRRSRLSDIAPTPAAARLVTAFTDARLLIQDREQDGAPVVEVAHEALLRNWPRLVNWIDKTADDLRLLKHLEQATAEWAAHNQSGTFLWPRVRWRQAQAMRKRLKPTLGESEQKFLRCSWGRSALRSASLAAGLAAVTLVGAFFLWSNSRNLTPGEALDVLALELGLHSVVEPEMIEVSAGTFLMGAKEDEPNSQPNEKPQREVTMELFWIGKYEVTFDEYDLFANVTGRGRVGDQGWGRGKRPVINVSWEDAVAYAKWLSNETGRNYCLPTEAEWEYAARAETTTRYWWGDELGRNRANCTDCGSKWNGNQTAPVGSFEANPFGLHDTAGNVWEWTCSEYRDPYDGSERRCASGGGGRRVLRGGSWVDFGRVLRSAYRHAFSDPDFRIGFFGFRLARGQTGSQCESEPEVRK
jgi:formylglycine-generating enzyme required for sulfatase activity